MTLLARLCAAEGGDRELDAEINLAVFLQIALPCPAYTASLDAAMMLVPEGWFLHDAGECVTPVRFKGDKHDPVGLFQVGLQWRDGGGRMARVNGKTLALALCISALKARGLPQ